MFFSFGFSYAQIVTTVAGNNTLGYSGDNGPATSAQLNAPVALAKDDKGNIYIADANNNVIRKVDAQGIITTIAGTGVAGFSGDGGPATAAQFNGPAGVAIDRHHNLYVSDMNNSRVRRIDSSGFVTTVAGNGTLGMSGDGGPATNAELNDPAYLALDAIGNLYIADEDNFCVWKVDTLGIITRFAGGGTVLTPNYGDGGPATAAIINPAEIAIDTAGNVLIADIGLSSIRIVDKSGIINTYPGSTNMTLDFGMTTDKAGNVFAYKSFESGGRIYKIDPLGNRSLIAGNPFSISYNNVPAKLARVDLVNCMFADAAGNLYFGSDRLGGGSTVRMISGISGSASVCLNSTTTLTAGVGAGQWLSLAPSLASVNAASGQVTGLATGNVTIFYVNGTDTASIAMTVVDTLPAPSVINGPNTICYNATSYLGATTSGGTWQATNEHVLIDPLFGVIKGSTQGTDTMLYINTNGCGGDTATFEIAAHGKFAGYLTNELHNPICADSLQLSDTVSGGVWASSNTNLAVISSTGVLKVMGAGTDTISYTVTDSACVSALIVPLITALPVSASPITGPPFLCLGATAVLSDSAFGGTWSVASGTLAIDSSGLIMGIAPGVDTIIYTNASVCDTAVASFVVTVEDAPSAQISGRDSVCVGDTAVFSSNIVGGVWISADTSLASVSASGVVTGVSQGIDSIYYVLTYDCGIRPTGHRLIIKPFGKCDDFVGTLSYQGISIYPNPAHGSVSIQTPASAGNYNLSVFNIQGVLMAEKQIPQNSGKVQFDITHFAAGTYLLKLQNGNTYYTQKVIFE